MIAYSKIKASEKIAADRISHFSAMCLNRCIDCSSTLQMGLSLWTQNIWKTGKFMLTFWLLSAMDAKIWMSWGLHSGRICTCHPCKFIHLWKTIQSRNHWHVFRRDWSRNLDLMPTPFTLRYAVCKSSEFSEKCHS